MEWVDKLNSVVNYIDENLDNEISYERISEIAGCSIYNFQRMFSYIADKSLAEYIRNRRLTIAVFDVVNSRNKIIDIAMKYGYDSHDSFTRAFQKFHGVLPSEARNETVTLKSCPKIYFKLSINGEAHMNYKIEKMPPFIVSGFKKRVCTKDAFKLVPQLWNEAVSDGIMDRLTELLEQSNRRPSGFIGICDGHIWSDLEEIDYYMGVTTYINELQCKRVEVLEGMTAVEFPQATWVMLEANGKLPDAVQKMYRKFYNEWLPNSGYDLEDLPIIECFLEEDKQEFWVAVRATGTSC